VSKLKVTWIGSFTHDGETQTESAWIPADNLHTSVIGETLLFRERAGAGGDHVYLIIPEARLVSAVEVEDEAPDA
jgi:hypothetical protein